MNGILQRGVEARNKTALKKAHTFGDFAQMTAEGYRSGAHLTRARRDCTDNQRSPFGGQPVVQLDRIGGVP